MTFRVTVLLAFSLFLCLPFYTTGSVDSKISLSEAAQLVEERLKETVEIVIKKLLPSLVRSSGDIDLSPECQAGVFQIIGGIKDLKPWAMHLIDANGKPPSGILQGAAMALGSYDQCLDIVNYNEMSKKTVFTGQYCSVEVTPFKPGTVVKDTLLEIAPNFTRKASSGLFPDPKLLIKSRLRVGLCIPSTCSVDDLREVAGKVSELLHMYLHVIRCETKQQFHLETAEYVSLGIFAGVAFVVVLCTIVDLCKRKKPKVIHDTTLVSKFVQTISFVSNTERFLSPKVPDSDISALAGIRFLSILWNILGNCYFLGYAVEFTHYSRRTGILEAEEHFTYGAISNFFVSYEVPFFVSGVLSTYVSLKRVRNSSKIRSVFKNLVEDIFRMTIITLATTLISMGLSHTNNGPLWGDIIIPMYEKCKINWWRNLVHISNFFPLKEMCLIHNWILSSQIQIQIVALAIILPILFMRRLGILINFLYMLGSIASITVLTIVYNLPPALDGVTRDYGDEIQRFIEYVVVRPYTHLGVYCIGIFVAVLIVEYKEIKMNKYVLGLGWILAGGCCIGSIYALLDYRKGYEVGVIASAIYAGLHRCVFGLAMGWVTFVCARTQRGLFKRILSWRVFAVVDQLTMIMYVVQPMLIISLIAATRERMYYNHDTHINLFFAITCRTLVISFILHVLVEQPVLSLNKWLFSRGQSSDRDSISSRKVPPPISARGISLKNILILEPQDGPVAGSK